MSEEKILKFGFDWKKSLLDPGCRTEIATLRDFVAEVEIAAAHEEFCGAIIHQLAPLSDLRADFIKYLKHDALFETLCIWLIEVRDIFTAIKNSKAYWLFAGSSDCLGSYFELAQICDFRLFFNHRSLVGFPAVEANLFPPLGGFERTIERTTLAKKFWEHQQTFTSKDARQLKLVDAIENTNEQEQEEFLITWFANFLRAGKLKPEKNQSSTPHQPAPFQPGALDELLEKIQHLGILTRQDAPVDNKDQNAWDFGWRLLKSEKSITSPKGGGLTRQQFGWIFPCLAARQLLNPEFLNRFDALAKYQSRTRLDGAEAPRGRIYVDLNYLVPPEMPMVRLLKSGCNLIFFAEDEHKLADGLNLMVTRLDRAPDFDLQHYWQHRVGWYHGHAPSRSRTSLQWFSDDVVKIIAPDGIVELLRFSGNRGRSDCGWCELAVEDLAKEDNSSAMTIGATIADGIIKAKKIAGGQVRLSMFLRSMFLEELVRLSQIIAGGSNRILTDLRSSGWGYVADESFWQFFLRTRRESYLVEAAQIQVGGFKVSDTQWNLAIWKELRELSKASKDLRDEHWSASSISQHFAVYAGLLRRTVHKSGLVENEALADVFVGASLGFPRKLGSPSVFLAQWGDLRTLRYAQKHWPEFVN